MDIAQNSFIEMVLRITLWAETQARDVLEKGRTLNEHEVELAFRAGVQYPEEVLLLPVPSIPIPEDDDLKKAIQELAVVMPSSRGLTIGYNIFLHRESLSHKQLFYQLVKVAQCENCGGIPGFFEKYLFEVQRYGYAAAPMEREALAYVAREFP